MSVSSSSWGLGRAAVCDCGTPWIFLLPLFNTTITDSLDRGQHISEIKSKTIMTLGFLRCNFAFAPRQTQAVAYKTFVRPKLVYASPVWHPHVKTQIQQVEEVEDGCTMDISAITE